jgi:transposase-like protein
MDSVREAAVQRHDCPKPRGAHGSGQLRPGRRGPLEVVGDGRLHRTVNVLDKLPQSMHGKAKQALHDIYSAESRQAAERSFDRFVALYQAKFPKAVECLSKDRESLLTFYDFPAEHWGHLRTTNPIESTFATVRLRQRRTKGCGR